VRGLGRCMYDDTRPYTLDQAKDAFTITDVNLLVLVSGNFSAQPLQ